MGACQKVSCVRVGFWVRVIFTLEVTVYGSHDVDYVAGAVVVDIEGRVAAGHNVRRNADFGGITDKVSLAVDHFFELRSLIIRSATRKPTNLLL